MEAERREPSGPFGGAVPLLPLRFLKRFNPQPEGSRPAALNKITAQQKTSVKQA